MNTEQKKLIDSPVRFQEVSESPPSSQRLPTHIPTGKTIEDLRKDLRNGCSGCPLGKQPGLKGPVLSSGLCTNPRIVFVGEAPGEQEDKTGEVFCGPAGQLLNRMIVSMDLRREDCYLTNIIKCRPIAAQGTGKRNYTPGVKEAQACRLFIEYEISTLKPTLVVLLGAVATSNILGGIPKGQLSKSVGTLHATAIGEHKTLAFITYHPAYLLRKQNSPEWAPLREVVLGHIKTIKDVLAEIQASA